MGRCGLNTMGLYGTLLGRCYVLTHAILGIGNDARRYNINAKSYYCHTITDICISSLLSALLPLEFYHGHQLLFVVSAEYSHTLPTHRTEPLGRILLDPGQETMLSML